MTGEQGSGPALDENFDFVVGPSGDLKNSDRINELEKDIGFAMAVELQEYIGSPLTPTTEQKLLNSARSVLEDEERIQSILEISVEEAQRGFDITTRVVVDNEKQSFVIPVGEFE